MGQLDAKTSEVAAATQEAATQKALVQQITKKLDVLAKQNKTLQKESAQHAAAREHQTEAAAQKKASRRVECLIMFIAGHCWKFKRSISHALYTELSHVKCC